MTIALVKTSIMLLILAVIYSESLVAQHEPIASGNRWSFHDTVNVANQFADKTYFFEEHTTLFEKIYTIDLLFQLEYIKATLEGISQHSTTFSLPLNHSPEQLEADLEIIRRKVDHASAKWNKQNQGFYMSGCIDRLDQNLMNRIMGIRAANDSCHKSFAFCTGTTYNYPAGVNSGSAQAGAAYGCLATRPNPAWYHLRIGRGGNILITMQSNPLRDIDYICWGPFNSPTAPCVGQLTANKIVSCSYSSSATEVCNIPNAQLGEYYILLITNFSNNNCNINFSQTGGTGGTDCTIVPPPISNNGPLCIGETLQLGVQNPIPGSTYSWTGPNGWTSTLPTPSISNVNLAHAGTYTLIITLNTLQSQPVSTLVEVGVPPTPSVTGPLRACAESIQNYTVQAPIQGNTYQWQVTGGNIDSGQGTAIVAIKWVNASQGTLRVLESSYHCKNIPSPQIQITIDPLPAIAATPSGPVEVCTNGQITNYTVSPAANTLSYRWELLPSNAGTISGTTTLAQVHWATQFTGQATIRVRGINDCGNGGFSQQLLISVNPFPSQPSVPVGITERCQSSQTSNYTISVAPNAMTYSWELAPSAAGSISGTTTVAQVQWSAQFAGQATIRVRGNNDCGQGIYSQPLQIQVNPLPTQPATPTGPVQFCQGTQVSTYSVLPANNATTYTWELSPTNAGTLSGTTTQAQVQWSAQYAGQATVRVRGNNDCGPGAFSPQLQVVLKPKPASNAGTDITIAHGTNTTLQGSAAGGSAPYSYQWQPASLLIDSQLPSPKTRNLYATTTFTLTVTDAFGCQSAVDEVIIFITGVALSANPTAQKDIICLNDSTRLFTNPIGGSGQYQSYAWTSNPPGFTSNLASPWVKPSINTTYLVSIWDGYNQSQPKGVLVQVTPLPIINLIPPGYTQILPNTIRTCVFDSLTLNAGNPGATYLWSNGATTRTIKVGTAGIVNEIQRHSVKVTNSQGCFSESNITILFNFADCTGVGIVDIEGEKVVMFPNPAGHFIHLKFSFPGAFDQYIILDFRGATMLAGQILPGQQETMINIGSLRNGVYVVRLTSQQQTLNMKLIVNK